MQSRFPRDPGFASLAPMRRLPTPCLLRRTLACALALVLLAPAGCGRGKPARQPLRFEDLGRDTAGLTRGRPLLDALEPYRMKNGVLRVRGAMNLPDGARIQLSIYRKDSNQMVSCVQFTVANHCFDSPPIIGPRGPLPVADYRFEVLVHFNSTWQPENVMRATHDGLALRGPGITRARSGEAAFFHSEERHL
jgi:hypothetical protein